MRHVYTQAHSNITIAKRGSDRSIHRLCQSGQRSGISLSLRKKNSDTCYNMDDSCAESKKPVIKGQIL